MKNLSLIFSLLAFTLGLASCSMTNRKAGAAGYYNETTRVKSGYETVQDVTVLDAKSGLTEVTERKVATYKDVEKRKRVPCPSCVRLYWLKDGCCGSDMDPTIKMATAQGPTGSPHVGLVPTMKTIVP